jgi:hypothetical protein
MQENQDQSETFLLFSENLSWLVGLDHSFNLKSIEFYELMDAWKK